MKVLDNYSLLPHNTFGIDVRCRQFVEYDTTEELKAFLVEHANNGPSSLLHIGGGSNLLFLNDFEGTILHSDIRTIDVVKDEGDEVLLRVGAAVVWDELVDYTLSKGLYGLENLSLIPGEVGASAVQNIGAYGAEAKDFIEKVECMNLATAQLRTFSRAECDYSYRHSIFKTPEYRGQWAVLYVTYRLSRRFQPRLDYGGIRAELEHRNIALESLTAQQLREVIIDIRRQKLPDPKQQGNAGSFFMNPIVPLSQYEDLLKQYPTMPHYRVDEARVKIPAGWLIEQCGWKGRHLGPAGVHDRQALVLVNCGGATGEDIVRLCEAVRAAVKQKFGIDIHPEVNFISSPS